MIFNPIVPKMEPTTYISSLAVGSSVWCEVNDTRTELLVVQQGNPDTSLYDASCDGTWCLFKNVTERQQWSNTNSNVYANSTADRYLNNEFANKLDIINIVKQVKIPYIKNDGSTGSGSDGLSCKIFLLSGPEIGGGSYSGMLSIGVRLGYFEEIVGDSAKRIAYTIGGTAMPWWTRSPQSGSYNNVWSIDTKGWMSGLTAASTTTYYARPAFILPFDTKIDKDNNIIAPPSEPEPEIAKKWVFNNLLTSFPPDTTIGFTTNGWQCSRIYQNNQVASPMLTTNMIYYLVNQGATIVYSKQTGIYDSSVVYANTWSKEAYKTIVFDEAPSGDLLTFLQANATPIVE